MGLLFVRPGLADEPPRDAGEIPVREGLVIAGVGRYPRSPLHRDAIEARIVAGRWAAPEAGEAVELPDGSMKAWEAVEAEKDGWFRHPGLRGGLCVRLDLRRG